VSAPAHWRSSSSDTSRPRQGEKTTPGEVIEVSTIATAVLSQRRAVTRLSQCGSRSSRVAIYRVVSRNHRRPEISKSPWSKGGIEDNITRGDAPSSSLERVRPQDAERVQARRGAALHAAGPRHRTRRRRVPDPLRNSDRAAAVFHVRSANGWCLALASLSLCRPPRSR
jgi:hypothetical protein